MDFDKLPYHVQENRKLIHIEAKLEEKKELRDLLQCAKECNVISLHLGKPANISKVIDAKSTPGKIKRIVKYAMGHANCQGLMTGETIIGIALLHGGVLPTANGDAVSLQMILFNYFKLEDEFSVLSELHQTEELGPVLAIIFACKEAERLVQMMNKQVAAFLYYFLLDAALPK